MPETKKEALPTGWKFWTVTALTCARFPIAVVVALLFWFQCFAAAVALIGVGVGTDWIDGPLARWWKVTTKLGRERLEPLADTALMTGILVGLFLSGDLPWQGGVVLLVVHGAVDFGLKRIVRRPLRIVAVQGTLMEVDIPTICTYYQYRIDEQPSPLPLYVASVAAILKRDRIHDFLEGCWNAPPVDRRPPAE